MERCDYEIREKVEQSFVNDILHLFNFFIDNDINVFARDGLLLGTIRHGGFLPFDSDPDVGILTEDYDKLKNAKIKGYELVVTPNLRNLSYYRKTGVPYDFAIYKTRPTKNFYNVVLLVAMFSVLLFIDDSFARVCSFITLLFLFCYNNIIVGKKILDGTVYPAVKEKDFTHYQEVERGEQHVFKDHYGHSTTETVFTFDKSDVLPLTTARFYNGEILVPRNYTKILIDHYGEDVFKVMYKKEDEDMKKINIENCIAPPAELVKD